MIVSERDGEKRWVAMLINPQRFWFLGEQRLFIVIFFHFNLYYYSLFLLCSDSHCISYRCFDNAVVQSWYLSCEERTLTERGMFGLHCTLYWRDFMIQLPTHTFTLCIWWMLVSKAIYSAFKVNLIIKCISKGSNPQCCKRHAVPVVLNNIKLQEG